MRFMITGNPEDDDVLVLKQSSVTPEVLAVARELAQTLPAGATGVHTPPVTRKNPIEFLGERDDSSTVRVRLEDVYYFESVSRKVFAYLKQGHPLQVKDVSIVSLETDLERHGFRRVSRTMIVNVAHLKEFKPIANYRLLAKMDNDETVVVSRKYVLPLKTCLREEVGETVG